jgi:hypothetical protein
VRDQLSRIAGGDGPGAEAAARALADGPMAQRLSSAILALARDRGAESSTCPSDAARAIGGEGWRALMPDAREQARELAIAGDVVITQRGEELDPDGPWHGPIRIRMVP